MTDYFEMIERRAEHPHSFDPHTNESTYQMQLDAFIKHYGPFKSVRRLPNHLNEWVVEAIREDGSVLRAVFAHPFSVVRMDEGLPVGPDDWRAR
jgi:hypothetical protein